MPRSASSIRARRIAISSFCPRSPRFNSSTTFCAPQVRCQYLYFCTSTQVLLHYSGKRERSNTCARAGVVALRVLLPPAPTGISITFVSRILQHTSAYVSIRIRPHTSACAYRHFNRLRVSGSAPPLVAEILEIFRVHRGVFREHLPDAILRALARDGH